MAHSRKRFQSAQAQQRGVDGTREILEGVVDGLEIGDKRVYIVDLLPNRLLVGVR